MKGVVTIDNIQDIFDTYGMQAAVLATYWVGTYLDFLVHYNLW